MQFLNTYTFIRQDNVSQKEASISREVPAVLDADQVYLNMEKFCSYDALTCQLNCCIAASEKKHWQHHIQSLGNSGFCLYPPTTSAYSIICLAQTLVAN